MCDGSRIFHFFIVCSEGLRVFIYIFSSFFTFFFLRFMGEKKRRKWAESGRVSSDGASRSFFPFLGAREKNFTSRGNGAYIIHCIVLLYLGSDGTMSQAGTEEVIKAN